MKVEFLVIFDNVVGLISIFLFANFYKLYMENRSRKELEFAAFISLIFGVVQVSMFLEAIEVIPRGFHSFLNLIYVVYLSYILYKLLEYRKALERSRERSEDRIRRLRER